jgi:SAM-dependent methyltransferase
MINSQGGVAGLMSELINRIDVPELIDVIQPTLFRHHLLIRDAYRAKAVKGTFIDDFQLSLIWSGEYRKEWVRFIKNNRDFDDCLTAAGEKLETSPKKRNEVWLKKYHTLYYSILDNGFTDDYPPIMAIHIRGGIYYRMDGTHRSSILYDMDITNVRVLVFELEDVMNGFPEVRNAYDDYILSKYPNYQEIQLDGDSEVHSRYTGLVNMVRQHIDGKSVADVGCNAGYLSSMLGDENTTEVHGFDISELDIEAARILTHRSCSSPDKVSFHLGGSTTNSSLICQCDVIFFIRSIYHIRDCDSLLKNMKPKTKIIVECNSRHRRKFDDPEAIIPIKGKRIALAHNLIPFLEDNGFKILEVMKNLDDVVIAEKI